MGTLLVILFTVLVLAAGGALLYRLWRDSRAGPGTRPGPSAVTGTTLIHQGREYPITDPPPHPWWDLPRRLPRINAWPASPRRRLVWGLVGVLGSVAGLFVLWLLPTVLLRPEDQFVVLVAPFRDTGGVVSQAGREAASELVAELQKLPPSRLTARSIAEPPADTAAALDVLRRNSADALIFGEIAPGGLLHQETLRPLLVYRPTGVYAPYAWEGYLSRFALPAAYPLATAPLNGQAVLPPLLGALGDYGSGRFDAAVTTLENQLLTNPSLDPTLPRMLLGNVLWARGEYSAAAESYRRIAAVSAPGPDPTLGALLANNLGAILQDAGDASARDRFNQAIQMLQGQDLGELRTNLGIEELRANRPVQAAAMLEQARRLLPVTIPVELLLARAYREQGANLFTAAQQGLSLASELAPGAGTLTTADVREPVLHRARSAVLQERGLQAVARAIEAPGPLLWEILAQRRVDPAQLGEPISDLESAIREAETVEQEWNVRSAAQDAAKNPISGGVANGQSRRALETNQERIRWLAAIQLLNAAQLDPAQPARGWFAGPSPRATLLETARTRLERLHKANDAGYETAILLGYTSLLEGKLPDAGRWFSVASGRAPERPEATFGQGLVAMQANPAAAREQFNQALVFDERFYPAREMLAQLAEADGNWPLAIEQRRLLAQQWPSPRNLLSLGQVLRKNGSIAEAQQVLIDLANNGNVPALLEISRLYRLAGNQAAAHMALQRGQEEDSTNPEIALARAELFVADNDLAAAAEQYRLAISNNPDLAPAHLGLAQIYDRDRKDEATREYRAALDTGTSDVATLKLIGAAMLARDRDQADAAVVAYERAVKTAPDDPEVQHGLAQAYLRTNKYNQARAAGQRALDLRQGNFPDALVTMGDIARAQEAPQEAESLYDRAIQLDNRLTAAYIGRGNLAAAQDNWAVARTWFQRAVESSDGSSEEAWLLLGDALMRTDKPGDAIQAYEQVLKMTPRSAQALFGLAQAQAAIGRFEAASANLDRALQARPAFADAYVLQGQIYEQRGVPRQALRAYDRAIALNSRLAEPHFLRALLRIRDDQIAAARGDLEAAVQLGQNNADAHYWLGRAYLVENRATEAIGQFQKAIEQRANFAEAYYYRGLAEEQLGNTSDAIAAYRAVLAQDSSGPWLANARAALQRLGIP